MLSPDRLAAFAGLVLLVCSGAWRLVVTHHSRRRLRTALFDDDPAVRASSVTVASSQGIGRYASALAELTRTETDRRVLDAIADAVARNRWEPADDPQLVELRLWADRRGIDNTKPIRKPTHRRILVTGSGGPAGVAVIRALRERDYDVVAADIDDLAAGSHLTSEHDVVLRADDPRFVDGLIDVATRHGVNAVVSTIAEEMLQIARRSSEIERVAAVWVPSEACLETCLDKWRFFEVMDRAGVRTPASSIDPDDPPPGPWIVKPRCARGSRGVQAVDDIASLERAMQETDDPIVQTRLGGAEFTVDALVRPDGEVVCAVPRWRLETKAGISTKGRTFRNDRVINGTVAVLAALGLDGVANVQGFVQPDGAISFVEVNPRFSGALPLSLAAGADIVGEYVRALFGDEIRVERLGFERGATMIRHFEEIYV